MKPASMAPEAWRCQNAAAMDDVQRDLGARVRHLRQQAALSQEQLAAVARLHTTYISGVERGAYNVSLQNLAKLAKALGVSIPELCEGDRAPAKPTEAERHRLAILRLLKRQSAPKLRTILDVVKVLTKARS